MTIASLLALCASIAYISIGIYAVRACYKSISSKIFLFFSIVLGLWALSYFELSFFPDGLYRLLWFCIAAAGWTLLPAALQHYSLSLKDDLRSGEPVFFMGDWLISQHRRSVLLTEDLPGAPVRLMIPYGFGRSLSILQRILLHQRCFYSYLSI